jgi:hypothetical protein
MEIDWIRLIIGVVAIGFGSYSIFIRGKSQNSSKLDAIKESWGDQKGSMIHLVAYGIIPIFLGLLMLFRALKDAF